MNVGQIKVELGVLKAFGIVLPLKGGIESWAWVAIACGAAKLASPAQMPE